MVRQKQAIRRWSVLVLASLALAPEAWAARYDGQFTLAVTDEQTGQPIPVRMELRNSRGRPVHVRASEAVTRDDYAVFDGEITLQLPKGSYRFLLEAGPEYQTRSGHFTIQRHAEDSTVVALRRHVNMRDEGWWAGDLDVRQRHVDVPLLKRAAGVSFTPELVRENLQGKCRQWDEPAGRLGPLYASLDYRRGGGLLIFGNESGDSPGLNICKHAAHDSSMPVLEAAHANQTHVVALSPYAWDLPLWVASDKLTAVEIFHRQSWPDGKSPGEPWGRPRDKLLFPGKLGNGRYSEAIYHHLLNCGVRMPPAAGSGSGANRLPLGTNRVYVHCGDNYFPASWFEGLRAGRVVVTNGPLLRTSVEGHPPGHVFHIDPGQMRQFQIVLSLSFYQRAPVEYLEIVKNGRVEHSVRLDELARHQGRLPPVEFDDSGWFLVRAITSSRETYQFASTGPYYVESNYQPRISRRSVEYFLTWIDEAAARFAENQQVQSDIEQARPYWQNLLRRATAD